MTTSQPPCLPCPPRYATRRNPDRPTLGPQLAATSALLGKPLLPWARYVADVSQEIDPKTGLLWYREINLLTPRQSTKTTLILVKNVHRATATDHFGPRQRLVYTAQTRLMAREKLEDDFVAALEKANAFRGRYRPCWEKGREHIKFKNGSKLSIDATSESSGHGPTLDGTDIDEAFSRVDNRTEQAAGPAMVTRPQPQLWVASTGGWLGQSPYLWDKVETGRRLVAEEAPTRRCYFEWSAPDDVDPGDEAVWLTCMPGLVDNGGIISMEAIEYRYIEAIRQGKLNEFRRAYLNQWVDQFADDEEIISLVRWATLVDLDSGPLDPVAFGVHITPDRTQTMIGVAGRRRDDLIQVELAAVMSGTDQALPWLVERARRWHPCAIVLDGTALALERELAEEGIKVAVSTNSATRAQATIDFYDAVIPSPDSGGQATIRHTGDPLFTAALKIVKKRMINQRWVWDGANEIGPLPAITLAHHGVVVHGKPTPPPATPLLLTASQSVGDAMLPGSHSIDLRSARF